MRRTVGLAALAAIATGITGIGAAPAATAAEPPGAAGASAAALEALREHPGVARRAPGQAFDPTSTLVDPDGSTHVRMDRTYRGLPVLGGDLVVHQGPKDGWEGVSQTLRMRLSLETEPVVPAVEAAEAALELGPVTRRISGLRQQGEPRLVVDATGSAPKLVWEVLTGGVQADGTPSRLASYVDARSGRLVRTEQQIQTVDGQGASLYSGTVPLQLTLASGTHQLKDPTRGNTYTTDMKNRTDSVLCQIMSLGCSAGTTFTSPDASFGTGATSSRESAAVDAQYGTNVTWDYFKSVHGRNGIFGNGTGSLSRVHYGSNYVNAFWDGKKMTYGDGDGVNYGPLVSLDVAGHEMSHGVTENTADLTYSGESGGLNEATSDIFGTLVEFHAANPNDPGDYLVGEEFDLKSHTGLRRMDQPSRDGESADCWTAGVGGLDVHYSSGVGNHFFYLLAEGSGAKTIGGTAHSSTTCDGSTVAGIGRDAAGKIWYRALSVYMTSGTSYAGARTATLQAASDLYGGGSAQHAAVAAAWSAVGVA